MLFITNRFPKGTQFRRLSDRARRFEFDLRINSAANALYFCETGSDAVHTEIGSAEMFERLRNCAFRQVLLFVHGYSTTPAEALARAQRLQDLCERVGPGEAMVVPLIWPTDNDPGLLIDYYDDQRSADASGFAFARAFGKFMGWRAQDVPCLKRINILAHSMGTRVLRESILRWNKDDLPNGVPMLFRNMFLVASDVINETLEIDQPGVLLSHAARNVIVYHAAEDLALRASKAANLRNGIASRRLGHTGPQSIQRTLGNVLSIDCDDFSMEYDGDNGHSYFLEDPRNGAPGRVFEHIFDAMRTGRVAAGPGGGRRLVLTA